MTSSRSSGFSSESVFITNGPNEERSDVHPFRNWNYDSLDDLAGRKKALVCHEGGLGRKLEAPVAPYCRDLIPCIKQLRDVLFPGEQRWETQDRMLYRRIKAVLGQARDDLTARMVQ